MPQKEYTIIVSGEKFVFSKGQLDTEPDNYFSTCFFGSFSEGEAQTLTDNPELVLYSDPKLFKLIEAHLRGYRVLPIPANWVPEYMTSENAQENLLHDARFYGLSRLQELVENAIQVSTAKVPDTGPPEKVYEFWQDRHEPDSFAVALTLSKDGCRTYLKCAEGADLKMWSSGSGIPYRSRATDLSGVKFLCCWASKDREGTEYTYAIVEI